MLFRSSIICFLLLFLPVRFCPRARAFTLRGANPIITRLTLPHARSFPRSCDHLLRFSHVLIQNTQSMRPVSGCRGAGGQPRAVRNFHRSIFDENSVSTRRCLQHRFNHEDRVIPSFTIEDFIIYRQKAHLSSHFLKKIDIFYFFWVINPLFRPKGRFFGVFSRNNGYFPQKTEKRHCRC